MGIQKLFGEHNYMVSWKNCDSKRGHIACCACNFHGSQVYNIHWHKVSGTLEAFHELHDNLLLSDTLWARKHIDQPV